MLAAGLHPIVKALASGQHYSSTGKVPAIAGIDGVGLLDGRPVYCLAARSPYGTMAQQTIVTPQKCVPLPANLDPTQAAAIANPGMSGWLSLKLRAGITAGETVLILGATGVAGQLAVQSARYLGAGKVIGVGRNAKALASLQLDASIVLGDSEDAIAEAFAAQVSAGIDVVIDYLWGRPTELLLAALAKGFRPEGNRRTRLIEVGESAGKTITLAGSILRSTDVSLSGSGFGSVPLDQVMTSIPTLFDLPVQGHLRTDVEPIPLTEVESTWTRTEKGRRIVFTL